MLAAFAATSKRLSEAQAWWARIVERDLPALNAVRRRRRRLNAHLGMAAAAKSHLSLGLGSGDSVLRNRGECCHARCARRAIGALAHVRDQCKPRQYAAVARRTARDTRIVHPPDYRRRHQSFHTSHRSQRSPIEYHRGLDLIRPAPRRGTPRLAFPRHSRAMTRGSTAPRRTRSPISRRKRPAAVVIVHAPRGEAGEHLQNPLTSRRGPPRAAVHRGSDTRFPA